MRKIIFIFCLVFTTSLLAQRFDKNWEKVIALEQEGKISSANKEVEYIYRKAKNRKEEAEMIKAFFYTSKYIQVLEEDATIKIITNLKNDIQKSSTPTQSLLYYIYAQCLESHLYKNKSKINQLTDLDYTPEADFRTWSNNRFENEIRIAYQKSVEAEKELQKTPLNRYSIILDFEKSDNFKKHTLYDFLASEAISYYKKQVYKNSDVELTESEQVLLNDTSSNFQQATFKALKNDNFKAIIRLFQQLEQNTALRSGYQFERLEYVNSILRPDYMTYLTLLSQFQKQKPDTLTLQKVLFKKASIYQSNASKETHPDYNRLAVKTYDSILALGMSNTYKEASNNRNRLIAESFRIILPKHSYNKQYTRASIEYSNINNATISFYKIDKEHTTLLYNTSEEENDSIKKSIIHNQKPVRTTTYTLQNKNDYFTYSTEVILPQLETGSYLVLFENTSQNGTLSSVDDILIISDITLLSYTKDNVLFFEAYHRKTGKPLENVKISTEDFEIKTDKNGRANIPVSNDYASYDYLVASKDQDFLYIDSPREGNQHSKNDAAISDPEIKLFTDRAIYRPGQTVFYKGIAIWNNKRKTETVANLTVKVLLKGPKNTNIKETEARTNEFGSFSGEFTLPENGITGQYSIEVEEPETAENDAMYNPTKEEHPFWDNIDRWNSRDIDFQVEEYKRPNFQIAFAPILKTFTVNQNIEVKGNAKAFSGSTISNAKVTYKIFRAVANQYNYYTNTAILSEGETQTDANGDFSVAFTTEPDLQYPAEKLPVFNYTINVSITDINGETRSAESNVKAAYHQFVLKTSLPPVLETDKKEHIHLNSTNLNNNFIPTKGTLEFYYIAPISNKWKNNYYNPEIKTIDDAVFDSLFPYEKRHIATQKESLVLKKNVNTLSDRKIPIDFISDWKTGNYKVVFKAQDSLGYTIEYSSDFKLFQSKDKQKPSDKLFTFTQLNPSPSKDGYVQIAVASNFADLYINADVYHNGVAFYGETFQLKNKKATIQIPIPHGIKHSIKVNFQTVFDNRIVNAVAQVSLKEEQDQLAFEVESIRNKIEPGSRENWAFRIKNKNETEVLASMYDSSLDQFTQTKWGELEEDNNYYRSIPYKTDLGFNSIYRSLSFFPVPYFTEIQDKPNNLIWFGFNFSNPNDPYTQKYYQALLNAQKTTLPPNGKMISGIVSEGGLPLPGVSVVIRGTTRGVQTDMEGYYSISAVKGDVLKFYFVGMETATVVVNNAVHNVPMKAEAKALNEVVVGALGIRKEETITLAHPVAQQSKSTFLQTLSGKVSGLQISEKPIRIHITGEPSNKPVLIVIDGKIADANQLETIPGSEFLTATLLKGSQGIALYGSNGANGVLIITTKKSLSEIATIKTRSNFNETAFFYPHLKTDKEGKLKFSFTSPEALTQWKLRLMGHDKKGNSGYYEDQIVTQKDLMITPNFPRFLREKDTVVISAKIANITYETKSGMAALQLFNATTMEPIDAITANQNNRKDFIIPAKGNAEVNWKIVVPEGIHGIHYKVVAKSGNFSDGEENILPVLTNRQLVTESRPLWVPGNSKKTYTLDHLKNNTSTTLRHHQITLEYTSNPTWLALQSLPYLMEYEHECSEQTFARYYANVLATTIINSNAKIATLFESWRKEGKNISKLEQNETLKSIILAETPWFRDSQSEAEKNKNLALLFDLDKMAVSTDAIFNKLQEKQKASGGFSWFENGTENPYITRHIMAGFGHLSKMKINEATKKSFATITNPGIQYIDSKFLGRHNEYLKSTGLSLLDYEDLHYLYTRSFYLDSNPLDEEHQKIISLYLETTKKNWLQYSLYQKALAALVFNRFNDPKTATMIISSFKETAVQNTDSGMYWIANKSGWYWYESPIETQALLIEAFSEIANDIKAIEAMKVWLLKNKQSQNWPTTKATTEAIYALLHNGNDWLSDTDKTIFKVGNEKIIAQKRNENQNEATTGYVKLNWNPKEISSEMATLSIENTSNVPGYGGYYWQYFEDLDQIKTHQNNLSTSKELYIKKTTKDGIQLESITPGKKIKVGDLVTVRIIIKATEDIDYVHLKDMRASGFEPIAVFSGYQWKQGLSYYQSTRDAATHFFFDQIRKGVYVIEYDVRANNSGHFSNGITTIQSMYAPEFASHTKGIRVKIDR